MTGVCCECLFLIHFVYSLGIKCLTLLSTTSTNQPTNVKGVDFRDHFQVRSPQLRFVWRRPQDHHPRRFHPLLWPPPEPHSVGWIGHQHLRHGKRLSPFRHARVRVLLLYCVQVRMCVFHRLMLFSTFFQNRSKTSSRGRAVVEEAVGVKGGQQRMTRQQRQGWKRR